MSEYSFPWLIDSARRTGSMGIEDGLGVSSSLFFFGLYFLLPDACKPSTRSAISSYKGNGLVHHCFNFGWLCGYMCIIITSDNNTLRTLRYLSQMSSSTIGMFFFIIPSPPWLFTYMLDSIIWLFELHICMSIHTSICYSTGDTYSLPGTLDGVDILGVSFWLPFLSLLMLFGIQPRLASWGCYCPNCPFSFHRARCGWGLPHLRWSMQSL